MNHAPSLRLNITGANGARTKSSSATGALDGWTVSPPSPSQTASAAHQSPGMPTTSAVRGRIWGQTVLGCNEGARHIPRLASANVYSYYARDGPVKRVNDRSPVEPNTMSALPVHDTFLKQSLQLQRRPSPPDRLRSPSGSARSSPLLSWLATLHRRPSCQQPCSPPESSSQLPS